MDNETYHRVMYEANCELIDGYYKAQGKADKDGFEKLYFNADDSGFVPTDHRTT